MSHATRFLWIRHAPTGIGDRYIGRTDAPAILPDPAALGPLWDALGQVDRVIVSPLVRARQTAGALFPELRPEIGSDLVEQDFGDWENVPYADVTFPEDLDADALAQHTPPNGESFTDVCRRVGVVMNDLAVTDQASTIAVVAHAGTIRAALVHALGMAPAGGIAFVINHLSLTGITLYPGAARVDFVNRQII